MDLTWLDLTWFYLTNTPLKMKRDSNDSFSMYIYNSYPDKQAAVCVLKTKSGFNSA